MRAVADYVEKNQRLIPSSTFPDLYISLDPAAHYLGCLGYVGGSDHCDRLGQTQGRFIERCPRTRMGPAKNELSSGQL